MRTLKERDSELEKLWGQFGDVPMDPETECLEEAFLHFPAGTFREDIWRWFDERYSLGVYHLLYPSDGSDLEECPYCEGRERPLYCRGYGKKEHEISPGVFLTSEELRQAYEKQEHIYDLQDIEEELDTFSEEYGLDEMPVTDTELEDMATDLRRRLDENADAIWSICRSEAIEKILKDRKEAPDADKARRSVVH